MFTVSSIRQQPIKPKMNLFDSIHLHWFLFGNLSSKGIVGQMIVKTLRNLLRQANYTENTKKNIPLKNGGPYQNLL